MAVISNEWGKIEKQHKDDFGVEMDGFIDNLRIALDSLSGGLELRQPKTEQVEGYETMDTRTFSQRVQQNPEIIPYLEGLLNEWCDQIHKYLDSPEGLKVMYFEVMVLVLSLSFGGQECNG